MASLIIRNVVATELDAIAKERGYKNWKHFTRTWMHGMITDDKVSKASYIAQAKAMADLGTVDDD